MKSVLISGGTGFIGSTLSRLLKQKGYDVTVVSRAPGVNRITWSDITKNGIPEGIEAIVNLTGHNVYDPTRKWTSNFQQNVKGSRIGPTLSLVQAVQRCRQKPKVFISISNVGIYNPSKEIVYDERSRLNGPFDFLSSLAYEWEGSVNFILGTRKVIVRSGVVLGRTGGLVKKLFLPFYLGLGGPLGDGSQYFPWIHVHDLCRLFIFCIENDKVKGVLNGVAPQIITNKEFTAAFAEAMNRKAVVPVRPFFLKFIFGNDRTAMMLQGQKVLPKRVTDEYGFDYLYSDINKACEEFAVLNYVDLPI